MIQNPQVGMRVQISDHMTSFSDVKGGELTCEFDSTRGRLGTLIEIRKMEPRGHKPKLYRVQLDPPNFGVAEFVGTEFISRYIEPKIVKGGATHATAIRLSKLAKNKRNTAKRLY